MPRSFVDLSITLCNDVVSDPPFLRPEITTYAQFGAPFVSGLSVVDALMFNDVPTVRAMCEQLTLTDG